MKRLNPDQPARDRIATDLTTNLLVEAGAGSGKTTSLIARLMEHVRTGTPVDRLTAVTFTRKAANELRERFQVELERRIREGDASAVEGERYRTALTSIDRAYLGTIHGFCARLLRERPLEVAIDPDFQETTGEDWKELERTFWRQWVERAKRQGDADLVALQGVALDPQQLEGAFSTIVTYPDVDFPIVDVAAPDVAACRAALERLIDDGDAMMPTDEPPGGWDPLMRLVRRLRFKRDVEGWKTTAAFCEAIDGIAASACKPIQKSWSDTKEGKAKAKALGEAFVALLESDGAEVLRQWREHRYPIVMRVLQRAAREFERQRRATGQLGFEDLLLLTAKLLREHPAVRDELGARYAHLLVDEFQDTDPVQAEVCFLLASDSSEGSDWRRVTPRPGALFVVGDPKQSIYRFRRADIQVYDFVKRRMAEFGAVLALTANFRSNDALRDVVNAYFPTVFPAESTPHQAAFSPMETLRAAGEHDGVMRYTVRYEGKGKARLLVNDAALVASWIAARIAAGERRAGDFLILTPTRAPIECYAKALAERNIAASTTGAELPQEHELQELLVVLRAIADPENAVAVVAALEGLFFGLSPADLWSARAAQLRFSITHPPTDGAHPVGAALATLHAWWQLSQRHAADILLDRILDETGLLVHAASQSLGDARAGALMHLVESLRLASVAGANGITDAMDRLALLLEAEAADTPLRPGSDDAVRIMNLHKAKGLEAPVVVLAAPVDEYERDPRVHVVRGDDGGATGAVCLTFGVGNSVRIVAQPPEWQAMAAAEGEFARAERERLRYVAATRAKSQLLVSQGVCELAKGDKPDASMWRPLDRVLAAVPELQLTEGSVPGRQVVTISAETLAEGAAAARRHVEGAATASVRVQTVTERSKVVAPAAEGADAGSGGSVHGRAWGSAMHRAIEAMARGRRGDTLRLFATAVAKDEMLPPDDVARFADAVVALEASGEVQRMRADGALHAELTVMRCVDGADGAVVTEGVIDAAIERPDEWRVVDWKTDGVDERGWERRRAGYEAQVAAYAEMLAALSGKGASGSLRRLPSAS